MFDLFKKKKVVDLGKPIIVVSGLPRSGTSMAMKMLDAGGLEAVQDGIRTADDDNPKGYFEDERVKDLEKSLNRGWLKDARGKVLKVISFLLKELPDANEYKIIFMRRHLDEVLASQNKMLVNRDERNPAEDDAMRKMYEEHLEQVFELMDKKPTMSHVAIWYHEMVADPVNQAKTISEFLGGSMDPETMASMVDKNLYRNRKA